MRKFSLIILTCLSVIYGQENSSETQIQSWFDFNGNYKINQTFKLYGDTGYRLVYISEKFHRLYVRSSGSLNLNKIIIVHAGFGLFTTFDNKSTLWEFRPFQGLEIKWPIILSIPINHYFRFEERFFSGNTIRTFLFRARYRLGTILQFNTILYFPFQLEWFVNYGSDIDFELNEFRGVFGLGYAINQAWKIELNTIFQNISASSDLFSFNDIIFRLRVFKEFGLIK
jgi:hypothetical protein